MEPHPQLPSLNRRIREALSRVGMVLRSDDWSRAGALGLNPTQLAILGLVGRRGGEGLGVREIAAHLGVSQPTATDSIQALERKGLVAKRARAADRRAVRVAATAAGLAALRDADGEGGLAEQAVAALDAGAQARLLATLLDLIRHFQEAGAIPVQRMCVTCRYFSPDVHADAARPHHCRFVDAAFGERDLRLDCRDHVQADPASRAATRGAYRAG